MIGDVSRGRALKQVVCLIDGQTLHANFTTRLLTCAHCGLRLEMTAAEADELYMLEVWPGGGVLQPELRLPALYAAHHISAVPAGQEPAQKLIGVRPHAETFKWRIVPGTPEPETPQQALERKADQFEVNGGRLTKRGACILATSQEVDGEGRPLTEYALCPQRDGSWRCGCQARVFCAHLAGLWRHYQQRLAEPNYPQRARALHIIAQLERQAGIIPERAPKPPAQVQAEGEAAADLLFVG